MNNKTIGQSDNFIILDEYDKVSQKERPYQTEANLENELIKDLIDLGYCEAKIKNKQQMDQNIKLKLEELNNVKFTVDEWTRFKAEYLDPQGDTHIDQISKIQENHIYDFNFDNGVIKNIHLINKEDVTKNQLQVTTQFDSKVNRYDVTILVNGLPLIHIELKKRGVAIKEAFNQIHRYSKESFNIDNSYYKYIQICIISNGTDTRYFANTTARNKNSYNFTIQWANSKNKVITDLKDFTNTFLQKLTILEILTKYCVFDTNKTLLIMRPYQIAATERIIRKINSSFKNDNEKVDEKGGLIWHTTGSGKTLTSFKAAQLATKLEQVKKVFFVVDRKDLDFQTMKEYQKFSPNSVIGSNSTRDLLNNIQTLDNKIIVTTIQKLNNLLKNAKEKIDILHENIVFIFDEAHRSQFGETQRLINKSFKKSLQFGFTGTPIFNKNSNDGKTTKQIFGELLHSYLITDAIRDQKVLKFKLDYVASPEASMKDIDLNHPNRIKANVEYILANFDRKTRRYNGNKNSFNAMFAVSSIQAAKLYYETFKKAQENTKKPLKVAAIFSYTPNEQSPEGSILEESFESENLDTTSKEFLRVAINDYNEMFSSNYDIGTNDFQNYYRDVSKKVINREIDLLIVVGMFLTGFDSPSLNTLFVDKNLQYHGLLQAFSRTNRILDSTKSFGNIVSFQNLEEQTKEALRMFAKLNDEEITQIIELAFEDQINGYTDQYGKEHQGFREVLSDLYSSYSRVEIIKTDEDKSKFVKLFGKFLRMENILRNYDEYYHLVEYQKIDHKNPSEVSEFFEKRDLKSSTINLIKSIRFLKEGVRQDFLSTYYDLKEEISSNKDNLSDVWDDITFEIELLKSQEIGLDYILELIYETTKNIGNKSHLTEEIQRIIKSSVTNRAKKELIEEFINIIDNFKSKEETITGFYQFASQKLIEEREDLIINQRLNREAAIKYINTSLLRQHASPNGVELNNVMPKMSPLNKNYLETKNKIFNELLYFVEKYKEIPIIEENSVTN